MAFLRVLKGKREERKGEKKKKSDLGFVIFLLFLSPGSRSNWCNLNFMTQNFWTAIPRIWPRSASRD